MFSTINPTHILYKIAESNSTELHFESVITLLKIVKWTEINAGKTQRAPIVCEIAYLSKKGEWHYTNLGPYVFVKIQKENAQSLNKNLFFSVKTEASTSEIFQAANACMKKAGWDASFLIPLKNKMTDS